MKNETPFEVMQRNYLQRDLGARAWREKGGKVVGYFCDSVPEELISAAGLFPLRIGGDPDSGTDVAKKFVIPRFTAREDFVHAMLNLLLTGRYDFLDLLIVPHARDSIHRLYQLLAEVKESHPEFKLPEIYFLDVLHTTFFSAGLYNRDRMYELKEKLEKFSGKEITESSLSRAIAVINENRMLLKQVAALRAMEPPRISGVEALQIIGSSLFMQKEDHNKLLRKYLEGQDRLPQREGARIFVSGSPLDNLQLYQVIESAQATVVGEDHCWGNRYSDVLVDVSLNPLEAIVDRYNFKSPCARMFPISRRIEYSLKGAVDAKAQGVIFHVFKNDGAESWEIPDKNKVIEGVGIRTLYLRNQPYKITDPTHLKTEIEEFVKSI